MSDFPSANKRADKPFAFLCGATGLYLAEATWIYNIDEKLGLKSHYMVLGRRFATWFATLRLEALHAVQGNGHFVFSFSPVGSEAIL